MNSTDASCPDQINHRYFWGNPEACGADMTACSGEHEIVTHNNAPQVIGLNAHYHEGPKIDYKGYAYPHPRTAEARIDIGPSPPTRLTVTE